MALLVTSIAATNLDEFKLRAQRAWAGGADAVEIRIDTFDDDPSRLAAYLKAHKDRTWIVTCRSAAEGGCFRGDTMERLSLLIAAARDTDAYVDFELADWRLSSNIRQKVLLASAKADGSTHGLILSAHDLNGLPADLPGLVDEIGATPLSSPLEGGTTGGYGTRPGKPTEASVGIPHSKPVVTTVGKVAYRAKHICDSFEALDLMHDRGSALTVIAMGEDGLWTRVLAKKLGAFASYCALDAQSATAPGQLTLDEMVRRYRWAEIDSSTRVFGVIGDPVAHSMSPLLFNRWFADAGVNAVYLPLRVGRGGNGTRRFLDACLARPWLDIGGFSVTLPHKTSALHWVGKGADPMAGRIGAINTLSFRDGKVTGHNTDCYAAVSSLADALGCSRGDLAGVPIDLLGTGGAARAVLFGLQEQGCAVTVYGRSPQKTRRIAEEFAGARAAGARFQSRTRVAAWEDRARRSGEVLINCTSVGMWPAVDASPMPADSLAGCRLVFDLIYNPLETRLLEDAAQAGSKTLSGLDMFVRQAAMQFTLWTGKSPDTQDAREMIRREIERRTTIIALIGLRGCGKSSVGRELADLLGGDLADTDELVTEQAGKSIAAIFAEEGEAGFRRRERDAIMQVCRKAPTVISVGGGAVLDERNVDALRRVATLVWLTAPAELLRQRVSSDPASAESRPPLSRQTPLAGQTPLAAGARFESRTSETLAEIEGLLTERSPLYQRAADLIIDTTDMNPREVAQAITARVGL